ncbi:MAG: LuxR C-terminal-related transcriptional regulator [Lentisphaeraceae bacterium]|nr:LuxR C-terminal-related transcriptional regulator [Lentisphaeraceae bacterium]
MHNTSNLDYKWIEVLSEFSSRLCSEDEKASALSTFSTVFSVDIDSSAGNLAEGQKGQSGLSPRLKEVYECLLENMSNNEIAEKLNISRHTVNDYAKQVLSHFMVSSRRELLSSVKNGRLINTTTEIRSDSNEEMLYRIMSDLMSMDISICERRRYFFDHFIKIIGAANYIWYESEFDPTMSTGPKALNVLTNFSPYQQQLFFEAANDPKLEDPYMLPSIVYHISTGNSAYLRYEFLDDEGWYNSEYTKKYYEPGNVDHPLTYTINQEGNQHCGILIYKKWKEEPFNETHRDFIDAVFSRIPWLFLKETQIDKSLYSKLTPRQHKALMFILDGYGKKELAEHFGISENSANEYIKNIYKTFGVNSYGELIKVFMH